MFGMGFTEIFLIAVVAVIALGPEKLPTVMVQIAKFFKQVKTQVSDAKESIENEIKISELKKEALEYKKKINQSVNELKPEIDLGMDEVKNSLSNINDSLSDDILDEDDEDKEQKSLKLKDSKQEQTKEADV
jgi:sec-independent protein translocase protein TatB